MKRILNIIIIISILIISCNNNTIENKIPVDTIKQIYDKNYKDYLIYRDVYLLKYEKLYNTIKNNKFNDTIISKIRKSIYESELIIGMYYKEEILYEAVILFYLKGYLVFLKDNYFALFIKYLDSNSYTPIFYIIFLNLSNEAPPKKVFIIPTCYDWVKNQPKYLKNPDIKAVVDSIKYFLMKRKLENNHILLKSE